MLAAALRAFLRYDGRDGLAKKIAEDDAWLARGDPGRGAQRPAEADFLPLLVLRE